MPVAKAAPDMSTIVHGHYGAHLAGNWIVVADRVNVLPHVTLTRCERV